MRQKNVRMVTMLTIIKAEYIEIPTLFKALMFLLVYESVYLYIERFIHHLTE